MKDALAGHDVEKIRRVSRLGIAIAVGGALIQLLLGVYYLAMAHSPHPHDLPVGLVGSAAQQAQLTPQLEQGGQFKVEPYADAASLTQAIKERKAYGGAVFTGSTAELYVASAATPSVASLLKASFTAAYQQQVAKNVAAVTQAGKPVPAATAAALATPPKITDVVPLPKDDSAGGSLGFIIQAISLGGSIASLALGRLGAMTQRSLVRGLGHALLLVVYALASAGVALLAASWFGVGDGADHGKLFLGLALVSLAVTASTAAAVMIFGPPGTLVGGLYFTVGLIISGASIAPEMLPHWGGTIGKLLPPGAGATVVRDALYFPDASTGSPFVVLGLYSVIGLLVVIVINAAANRTHATSFVAEHAS
ncbi:ABC transporter permease [Nocardioides maradonensis]